MTAEPNEIGRRLTSMPVELRQEINAQLDNGLEAMFALIRARREVQSAIADYGNLPGLTECDQ